MVSFTPREIYEKAMAAPEYDRKTVMLFGLTSEQILKRIEFYDNHVSNDKADYLAGYLSGFEQGFKLGIEKSNG